MNLGKEGVEMLLPRFIVLFIVSLFVPASSLMAQDEAGASSDGKDKSRYAYLVCTKIPKGVDNPVKMLQGKKLKEIVLSLRSASMRVKLPSDGKFQLVKEVPAGEGQPEVGEGLQVIASAQIPKGVRQAIIILTPAVRPEAKKAGLVFETYVQDIATFKGGNSMYVNLTDQPIGVQIGDNKKNVKPKAALIMETGVRDQPKNFPVSYWSYEPEGKNWKRISASTIAFYPTRRQICFFFTRANGRIAYRGVTCPVEN